MLEKLKAIKTSRKIIFLLLILYAGVVLGFTRYSQTGYVQNLPTAYQLQPPPVDHEQVPRFAHS